VGFERTRPPTTTLSLPITGICLRFIPIQVVIALCHFTGQLQVQGLDNEALCSVGGSCAWLEREERAISLKHTYFQLTQHFERPVCWDFSYNSPAGYLFFSPALLTYIYYRCTVLSIRLSPLINKSEWPALTLVVCGPGCKGQVFIQPHIEKLPSPCGLHKRPKDDVRWSKYNQNSFWLTKTLTSVFTFDKNNIMNVKMLDQEQKGCMN